MSHTENYQDTGHTTAFYQGRDAERERIIKLLQETRESRPCQCDECGDHVWGKAIDLIKGKQK